MNSRLCCRFKEIAEFVVQSLAPPVYALNNPTLNVKKCDYCRIEIPERRYKDHLVSTHSSLLFHCDECDTYVDKKDFLVHMSIHAVQYATNKANIEKKMQMKNKTDISKNVPKTTSETQTDVRKANENNTNPNEFSDHSDMEYFGIALPESVFEAIEDSQDSQPVKNEPNETGTNSEVANTTSKDKKKKPRKCSICSKTYTAASSYFYHMKNSHKMTKEFECGICGKKLGTKACLVQHYDAIHNGETKYSCKECGKKFRSKASQYIHEQTHNGVKAYSCNQCRSSFRWKTHLLRHMKRHSSEKAHVCSACGRGFNIHCDLLRHARTHTAGSFKCEKCGIKFSQKRYLKVHMNKKHSSQNGTNHSTART